MSRITQTLNQIASKLRQADGQSPTWPIESVSEGQFLRLVGEAIVGAAGGGGGGVSGPATSTDNAIARFDGALGDAIQNSLVTVSDTGSISLPASQTVDGVDVSTLPASITAAQSAADAAQANIDSHEALTNNPHATSIANIGAGTHAQLNTAVSDADLVAGPGTVVDRSIPTYNGTSGISLRANATPTIDVDGNVVMGAGDTVDSVDVSTLPADITAAQNSADSAQSAADAAQANIDSHEALTNNPHATSIANIGAGTFAQLNTAVSDANLVADTDSRLTDDRTASGLRTATTIVVVSAAAAPSANQVLTAINTTSASWQTPAAGGGLTHAQVSLRQAFGGF